MKELTGTVLVSAPPEKAWQLFTPEGERSWAAGWDPRYPGDSDEVFETGGDAHHPLTTWITVAREPGRSVSYTRVVAGRDAGTVTVELTGDGNGGSTATVTYRLTPLTDAGRAHLDRFAAGYADYLRTWEEAIGRVTG